MDEATDATPPDDKMLITDILREDFDLFDALGAAKLGAIGSDVVRDVAIDEKSREEWMTGHERALKLAMQVKEAKNHPWQNASNVKYPLVTVGAIQFQHRAYPAIIDGNSLVKGRVIGPDQDGQKRARADRIGQHMTWQLMFKMKGWHEDTDRLLLMLPIVGCVFRKAYFDPITNTNCAEMVGAKHFIINYWAKSIEKAPRYTHVLEYHPYEVRQMVAAGLWREVPLVTVGDDEQSVVEFYEQHRLIDLDGDGYPEPYIVTTNKHGAVARIVPCYGPENVFVRSLLDGKVVKVTELLEQPDFIGPVVRIEKRKYFVKYGFIPSPDGSFYDIGFGALLNDINSSINTIINQLIDAGTLQNAGGGWYAAGAKLKAGDMRFRAPGEYKPIQLGSNMRLQDAIMNRETTPPSASLFQLLGLMIDAAKEITSVQEIMTGQGTANQPATTTLALIEQGQMVMTGIFKRIHRAFGEELTILRSLNARYLDDEEYFNLNDADAVQIGRDDYEDDDLDVIPVSDPTSITDMQKMARAEALMVFRGDPMVDQQELYRRYFEALGTTDTAALFAKEKQPDPALLMAMAQEAREKEKTGAEIRAKDSAAAKALTEAAANAAALGLPDDAAALVGAAVELGGDVDEDSGEMSDDDSGRRGGIPGMGEAPDDGQIPDIPSGSESGLSLPMGGGAEGEPTGSGQSDGVGGITGGAL